MQTLRVNDYDMAYLDLGPGGSGPGDSGPGDSGKTPLVCVHGSLNDFRAWVPVMGPLSVGRRLIMPSLRHYFPEHWDGQGGQFKMAQHVDDTIAFIEGLDVGPVDLLGHSRGGHLSFRLALKRPDLVRRLVLAEPGGTLDGSLALEETKRMPAGAGSREHVAQASEKIAAGDLEGGLRRQGRGGGVERANPVCWRCRHTGPAANRTEGFGGDRARCEVRNDPRRRPQHVPPTAEGLLRCSSAVLGWVRGQSCS
jgi:esterase